MSPASCPRSVPRHRKRWLELFEHGKMPHVEGRKVQAPDIGGSGDEVVAQSNPVVAAAISAHHGASAAGDHFGRRLYAKRRQQAPHLAPLDAPHAVDELGDRYHADRPGSVLSGADEPIPSRGDPPQMRDEDIGVDKDHEVARHARARCSSRGELRARPWAGPGHPRLRYPRVTRTAVPMPLSHHVARCPGADPLHRVTGPSLLAPESLNSLAYHRIILVHEVARAGQP